MKNIIKILIGITAILSAIIGYRNSLDHFYELTFLSNLSCGLLLLVDGVLCYFNRKSVPIILYQMIILCTNVVFFTCIFTLLGLHSFNFSGAFTFLHAINPPLFLMAYLFFTELKIRDKTDYIKRIFISPLLIMVYLCFDYIRYLFTGTFVYGLVDAEKLSAVTILLIGIGFYFLMAFMSYGLIELKLHIQKKCPQG